MTPCFYCGVPANSTDHVVPLSLVKMIGGNRTWRRAILNNRVLTVSACRECNSLLSDSFQDTLEQRRGELKERLRKKFAKYLAIKDWEDRDLMELGPMLQDHVLIGLAIRDFVRKRLAWHEARTEVDKR